MVAPFLRILALGSLALICRSRDASTFTIAGHVVRHLDQHAVKGVRVSITMLEDTQRQVAVVTGENGEFSFQDVPGGKYRLSVTDHGASQFYQETEGYSTAIVTGPRQDSEHIVFSLDSPASLSGTVVDEDNDPVPHAEVYLMAQSVTAGKYQTRLIMQNPTNLSGEFQFRHLSPGTYYVAVAGRPWYAQNISSVGTPANSHSDLDVTYPVTYYSGVTSPEGATPIKLEEGAIAEVQFTLHAVPALHVTIADGLPEAHRQRGIRITQVGPGGIAIHLPFLQTPTELLGIAPGNYFVDSQPVSLISDTALPLNEGPKTSARGRVLLNGDPPNGLMVALQNDATRSMNSEIVHPDGSFDIPGVTAGHYLLALLNVPDIYVAKAAVKGAAYANGELQILNGAQVELILTPGHGLTKVDGIVVDDKKPAAGAIVLLIPQDPLHGNTIARDQSDADGTFTLDRVTPGRYTLVAIDDGHGLAYADPAVIAPYLEHGRVLDLPLTKDASVEIQVQRRK